MPVLGIMTGGGDCPGTNAVIRAAVKTAQAHGYQVLGFKDGYLGLVENRWQLLDHQAISGLLHRGGTILGTNNRLNPFHYPVKNGDEVVYQDLSARVLANVRDLQIQCLLVIGGDGTLAGANELASKGLPIIGVPKTIDNDLMATDQTFGFDTAVTTATEALDRLHTTAESHHRVMVLEVMGRYAGWIALASGMAGGADVILIPEIPWHLESVVKKIRDREKMGKPFSIVVVAEGVKGPRGMVTERTIEGSPDPVRLGGIGKVVGDMIEENTGMETRVTVLGHIQRGGSPSPYDRILATKLGARAALLAVEGQSGLMVALRCQGITAVPLAEASRGIRTVPPEDEMVMAARALGISLGD